MKYLGVILIVAFYLVVPLSAAAQTRFLASAPTNQRVPLLWRYCSDNQILDWDSAASHQFLNAVAYTADSLGDQRLASYAQYFQRGLRILFSLNIESKNGDYRPALALLTRTKAWALAEGYPDIAASCDHFTGRAYFDMARYGPAFEYLLKAQEAFRKIGYDQVPYMAGYFYNLGSNYYQFEDFDKALAAFLAATRYPFYTTRTEINTFNAIGLIYARQKNWRKAMVYYRKTSARATAFQDKVWVGISMGNLGQAWLAQGQPDSALFYLRRSYNITSNIANRAPEDAAYTSLAMATVFVQQQQLDSAWFYVRSGQELGRTYILDAMGNLAFRRRLLPVLIELHQVAGNYKTALHYSNSLTTIKDSLQHLWDARILSQAANKVEVERYQGALKLLESQKKLTQLRFYLLVGTLLAIIIVAGLLFNRFRVRKKSQIELAKKELHHAEELLGAYLTALKEKTALVESLSATNARADQSNVGVKIESLITSSILTDDAWQHFRRLFDQVHPGFVYHLKERFPDLSPAETRLLILTKLNLSTRDMAHTLGISISAIRQARYRLRKKFHLEEEAALDILIQNI